MTMGEKILTLRKSRGWSQEELADRLSVTRQAISRWESDSAKPDADNIIALCDLFEVSADYLLRDRQERTESRPGDPAPAAPARRLTKKQLCAWVALAAGGLVQVILWFLYIIKKDWVPNTYTVNGALYYKGFMAFVLYEKLTVLWFAALAAIIIGAGYLLMPRLSAWLEKAFD